VLRDAPRRTAAMAKTLSPRRMAAVEAVVSAKQGSLCRASPSDPSRLLEEERCSRIAEFATNDAAEKGLPRCSQACRWPSLGVVAAATASALLVGLVGLLAHTACKLGAPLPARSLENTIIAGKDDWTDLTDNQRTLVASLGITQLRWDTGSFPDWEELTTRERNAFQQIGYTEALWHHGDPEWQQEDEDEENDDEEDHDEEDEDEEGEDEEDEGGEKLFEDREEAEDDQEDVERHDREDIPTEPNCPSEAVQLQETGRDQILKRVVQAAGGNPRILVLACGTQKRSARTGRLTEAWVNSTGFEMEYGNYAKFDKAPFTTEGAHVLIKNFFSRSAGRGTVIMYSGQGRKGDGAWGCHAARDGGGVTLTPSWVKGMAESVGARLPVIVTDSCFGGAWLGIFDGVSSSRPDQPTSIAFSEWLTQDRSFPLEPGRYPMCRGLPDP